MALFAILLAASLIFYRERMLFVDPGWIVFNIINDKSFLFAEHRYGAFITQIVPLAGVYLHLPLKALLIAYSASFQLFYLIVAGLLVFRYRQRELALLLAFYFILFVSDEFFWPNNEVHQGITWMFLFLGLFRYRAGRLRWHHHLLLASFGFLALFSHFLVALPFSFLWLYFLSEKDGRRHIRPGVWVAYSLYLLLVFGIKYSLGHNSWYDGAKLDAVKRMDIAALLHSFANGQARYMFRALLSTYVVAPLLFLAGSLFALLRRQYLPVILSLGCSLAYIALVCLTYPEATTRGNLFYMESEWMGLAVPLSALFVFRVLPAIRPYQAAAGVALIFLVRICFIAASAPVFMQRSADLSAAVAALQQRNIPKAVVVQDKKVEEVFIMSWGAPVESLMLSALDGGRQVSFRIMPGTDIRPVGTDTFRSCFTNVHYKALNPAYFRPDTLTGYQVLPYGALQKDTKD